MVEKNGENGRLSEYERGEELEESIQDICLNIEPYMQPKPSKNKGGDCFACALTATFKYLFPEKNVQFDDVWNYFMGTYYNSDTPCLENNWIGMQKAIQRAKNDGYEIEMTLDIVKPEFDLRHCSYNFYHFTPAKEFNDVLEKHFKDGWVALQNMKFNGEGAFNKLGGMNTSDHFVAVDGVKESWEPIESKFRQLIHYTHVVCSAKGTYWIKTEDFLKKHGAAGMILVRRIK